MTITDIRDWNAFWSYRAGVLVCRLNTFFSASFKIKHIWAYISTIYRPVATRHKITTVGTIPFTETQWAAGGLWPNCDFGSKNRKKNNVPWRFPAHIDPDQVIEPMSTFVQGKPWQLGGRTDDCKKKKKKHCVAHTSLDTKLCSRVVSPAGQRDPGAKRQVDGWAGLALSNDWSMHCPHWQWSGVFGIKNIVPFPQFLKKALLNHPQRRQSIFWRPGGVRSVSTGQSNAPSESI